MAKSLKDKFKSLRNRFLIDDAEYRSMCNKLDRQDYELLDKVAEKLKERFYYMETEEGWGGFTVTDKDIDEAIAELKAVMNNE